jgi:hypothetical protein
MRALVGCIVLPFRTSRSGRDVSGGGGRSAIQPAQPSVGGDDVREELALSEVLVLDIDHDQGALGRDSSSIGLG